MRVKFHGDVIGCGEDIAHINEFGAMHMNIHSDAHDYSLECPYINIISAGDISSLSKFLVDIL